MNESDRLYYESRDKAKSLVPKSRRLKCEISELLSKFIRKQQFKFNSTEEEVITAILQVAQQKLVTASPIINIDGRTNPRQKRKLEKLRRKRRGLLL